MDKKNLEYQFLKELGLLIANLRSDKEITRMEFSRLTGLNRQHLYYVEIGQRSTTIYTLAIIADGLDVTLSDFFMQLEERMNQHECL